MTWHVSSSSDRAALDIVDGVGRWEGHGPHYSRRTPGSKTFTGVGREVVLVTEAADAVWAVVWQRTPSARGSGSSRGRSGEPDPRARHVWRNMCFRNIGRTAPSSSLVMSATARTYAEWARKYGSLPAETLRTEIDPSATHSPNPGYCYKLAGYHNARVVRGKVYLDAPCPLLVATGACQCCRGSLIHKSQTLRDVLLSIARGES